MAYGSTTLTRYDITDLNNGKIDGFPVADPPGWDDISLFYAKALQTMGWNESGQGPYPDAPQSTNPNDPYPGTPNVGNTWDHDLDNPDPSSYFFWGGMHWWPGDNWEYWNDNAPSPQNEYWSHCTHGPAQTEKYFLPWHRAYIYFYEMIIRERVAALGGPADWSLPYWNYSGSYNASAPQRWPQARLPWIFCQPELPDGSANPLVLDVTRRGLQPVWPPQYPLAGQPMFLGKQTPFYNRAFAYKTLYEEPTDNPNLMVGFNITLDYTTHGSVHNDTGDGTGISNTGWMQNTQVAGFDPIFWMHHSEIDRFWVLWNAKGGLNPNEQPTPDPDWAAAADDPTLTRWNFWFDGKIESKVVIHPGDMLDPANLGTASSGYEFPYSYTFQNMPQYPPPVPPSVLVTHDVPPSPPSPAPAAAEAAAPAQASEVAGSDQPVEVHHEPATTSIPVADGGPALLEGFEADDAEPPRVYLRLEGVAAEGPTGNYEVYLNNPDVDRNTAGDVPHFVGLLSTFGANHSHGGEPPHGINAQFDITQLVAYLRAQGEWSDSDVNVTFVPAYRPIEGVEPAVGKMTVRRVSIQTG